MSALEKDLPLYLVQPVKEKMRLMSMRGFVEHIARDCQDIYCGGVIQKRKSPEDIPAKSILIKVTDRPVEQLF